MIVREALRSIRRTPLYWFASVLTLGVAIGVGGLFTLLSIRAHQALQQVRKDLTIEAFFDPSLTTEQARTLMTEKIAGLPEVGSVQFVSKEEALQDFANSSGENVQEVLGLNPLPASVSLHLREPGYVAATHFAEKLRSIEGISDVRSDLSILQTLEQRAKALGGLSWTIGGLLLLSTALFVILTARSLVRSRSEAIRTFSLLGATRSSIAWTIIIENVLAGLAGGAVGALILMLLQHFIIPAVGGGVSLFHSSADRIGLLGEALVAGVVLEGLLTYLFATRYSRSFAV